MTEHAPSLGNGTANMHSIKRASLSVYVSQKRDCKHAFNKTGLSFCLRLSETGLQTCIQ